MLGIGMGAEWPVGAALAMGSWPIRSRGFMAGVLQASWGLGVLLSSAAYGLLYNSIGWRGLLMLGVLPALSIVYVRKFVQEPPVWLENRRLQRAEQREVKIPLFKIFKRGMLYNTLTACWWMASAFIVGYSVGGLFPTYLQKDLHLSPGMVAMPVMLQSIVFFLSGSVYGWLADRIGRRWAIIFPALLNDPGGALLSADAQLRDHRGVFRAAGGVRRRRHAHAIPGLPRRTLPDRGARDGQRLRLSSGRDLWRPGVVPVITYFAVNWHTGFAIPMLIGTTLAAVSVALAVLAGPETRGTRLVAELSVA